PSAATSDFRFPLKPRVPGRGAFSCVTALAAVLGCSAPPTGGALPLSWFLYAAAPGRMTEPSRQYDLQTLGGRFGLPWRGDGSTVIRGVGTLERADGSQLAFLANSRYTAQLAGTQAGVVVLSAEHADASPVPVLVADDP